MQVCVHVCVYVCVSRIYLLFSSNSLSHVLVGVHFPIFNVFALAAYFELRYFFVSLCRHVCACVRVCSLIWYKQISFLFMILLICRALRKVAAVSRIRFAVFELNKNYAYATNAKNS